MYHPVGQGNARTGINRPPGDQAHSYFSPSLILLPTEAQDQCPLLVWCHLSLPVVLLEQGAPSDLGAAVATMSPGGSMGNKIFKPTASEVAGGRNTSSFLGCWGDGRWGHSCFYPLVPDPCIPPLGDTAQYNGH